MSEHPIPVCPKCGSNKTMPAFDEGMFMCGNGDCSVVRFVNPQPFAEPTDSKLIDELRVENARLRKIVADCINEIGNWSVASADGSIEFLKYAPTEIRLAFGNLRAENAELKRDKALLDWLDKINQQTNDQLGTTYGWKFDRNHLRATLSDHFLPALTIRQAIDAAKEGAQ